MEIKLAFQFIKVEKQKKMEKDNCNNKNPRKGYRRKKLQHGNKKHKGGINARIKKIDYNTEPSKSGKTVFIPSELQ